MENFYLKPPKNKQVINEIYSEVVCPTVKFKLDKELFCQDTDIFMLIDGQWFLIQGTSETLIEGRWTLVKN